MNKVWHELTISKMKVSKVYIDIIRVIDGNKIGSFEIIKTNELDNFIESNYAQDAYDSMAFIYGDDGYTYIFASKVPYINIINTIYDKYVISVYTEKDNSLEMLLTNLEYFIHILECDDRSFECKGWHTSDGHIDMILGYKLQPVVKDIE